MFDISNLKVIVFDFGGVLINLKRQNAVDALVNLGVNDADELLNNYVQAGIFLKLERGEVSLDEFHDYLHENYNISNVTNEQLDDAIMEFLLDVPDEKLSLLRRLRKGLYNAAGERIRIVILSNTNELHFPISAKKYFYRDCYTIDDYFDYCYLSYEMNMSKPDDEIYLKLLECEGCVASEALFLDDGKYNIEAAARLGFNTYLVKEHENLTPLFPLD